MPSEYLPIIGAVTGVIGAVTGISGAFIAWRVAKHNFRIHRASQRTALAIAKKGRSEILKLARELSVLSPRDVDSAGPNTDREVLHKLSGEDKLLLKDIAEVWPSAIYSLSRMQNIAARLSSATHAAEQERTWWLGLYGDLYRELSSFLMHSDDAVETTNLPLTSWPSYQFLERNIRFINALNDERAAS